VFGGLTPCSEALYERASALVQPWAAPVASSSNNDEICMLIFRGLFRVSLHGTHECAPRRGGCLWSRSRAQRSITVCAAVFAASTCGRDFAIRLPSSTPARERHPCPGGGAWWPAQQSRLTSHSSAAWFVLLRPSPITHSYFRARFEVGRSKVVRRIFSPHLHAARVLLRGGGGTCAQQRTVVAVLGHLARQCRRRPGEFPQTARLVEQRLRALVVSTTLWWEVRAQ
jgi:hypothetical protein